MMPGPPLPGGQRRFWLDGDGRVMVAGRFEARYRVEEREATAEDLACLSPFGRRVLDTAQGWWDVSSFHWTVNRTLARPLAVPRWCPTCGTHHEQATGGCPRANVKSDEGPRHRDDPHARLIAVAASLAQRRLTPDLDGYRVARWLRCRIEQLDDHQGRLAGDVRDSADELSNQLAAECLAHQRTRDELAGEIARAELAEEDRDVARQQAIDRERQLEVERRAAERRLEAATKLLSRAQGHLTRREYVDSSKQQDIDRLRDELAAYLRGEVPPARTPVTEPRFSEHDTVLWRSRIPGVRKLLLATYGNEQAAVYGDDLDTPHFLYLATGLEVHLAAELAKATAPSGMPALPPRQPASDATCTWTEDADGIFHTTCGNAFTLIDAGPSENGMRWCCYCGALLQVDQTDGGLAAIERLDRELGEQAARDDEDSQDSGKGEGG
jgi:hypothetical protein